MINAMGLRPKSVVYGGWDEILVIEEDAERLDPIVFEIEDYLESALRHHGVLEVLA